MLWKSPGFTVVVIAMLTLSTLVGSLGLRNGKATGGLLWLFNAVLCSRLYLETFVWYSTLFSAADSTKFAKKRDIVELFSYLR